MFPDSRDTLQVNDSTYISKVGLIGWSRAYIYIYIYIYISRCFTNAATSQAADQLHVYSVWRGPVHICLYIYIYISIHVYMITYILRLRPCCWPHVNRHQFKNRPWEQKTVDWLASGRMVFISKAVILINHSASSFRPMFWNTCSFSERSTAEICRCCGNPRALGWWA